MSEGDAVPNQPLIEKIKGFCPHCQQDLFWERINLPETEYKYRKLLYQEAKVNKVANDCQRAMFQIEKIFKEVSEKFTDLKLQLELSEGQEPCR